MIVTLSLHDCYIILPLLLHYLDMIVTLSRHDCYIISTWLLHYHWIYFDQMILKVPMIVVKIEGGVGNRTVPLLITDMSFQGEVRNWSSKVSSVILAWHYLAIIVTLYCNYCYIILPLLLHYLDIIVTLSWHYCYIILTLFLHYVTIILRLSQLIFCLFLLNLWNHHSLKYPL